MKKIAIFGGSFDPFTPAHRNIVEKASEIVNEILIVPTIVDWYRQDKDKWLTNEQKIETIVNVMTNAKLRAGCEWSYMRDELDLQDTIARFGFDGVEKDRYLKDRCFFDTLVDILKYYNSNYENEDYQFYFIVGTDQCKKFKEWKNWQSILKYATMIVVQGRDNEVADTDIPHITIKIDPEFADVSGTKLRAEWQPKGYEQFKDWCEYEYRVTCGEEEVLEHTPIFDLVRAPLIKRPFDPEKCKGANKYRYGLRPYLIKAPDWATVIVEKNGQYLMVNQFRYGTKKLSNEFPCGMIEKDELPLNAALRELREETGLVVPSERVLSLGHVSPNPAFMTNHMFYFYVNLDLLNEDEYRLEDTEFDENEDIKMFWKDAKEVERDMFADPNTSSLMIAALAKLNYMRK